ncbi:class IV lanthionine synthetase LanL [Kitasatospora purpeofusca]|uniref:class IV lanthionine synthetase LanL n=1 Tax=Kitasatospora purpeofusca TaxID=67352 RepID=UPI0022509B0D|nr:class IV lanthionine synthetase LanL [Kitasatospora purpeofusca]MCX4683483.1 class IV lanthionine synthetase LanL [Kitasatospora purpeofusca]
MVPAAAGGEPDDGPAGDVRSRLAAHLAAPPGARRRLHSGDGWLYLQDPRMPELGHGWKLHLSARPDHLPDLVDLVLPVLLGRTCDAKFAASTAVLHQLNSGLRGAAGVGKAVTVYPAPEEAGPLAEELAEVLAGRTGPRVVSDRRLRPDAPVYYRYGPFRVSGDDPDLVMTGPDGRTFPGLAEPSYRQPPWAADPFTAADPTDGTTARSARPAPPTTRIGDGRYRLTAGITRSPNGHVYRAVEVAGGREVVVKQARAFVAEDRSGTDARGRLRHERRVLAALAGVHGVPDLVDYFRHGEDEYLVSTARGPRDLRRAVLEAGPYDVLGDRGASTAPGTGTGPGRDWWALARGLLAVLDAVHARGVVVHDLKPANVVLDDAGGCSLVDFGVSSLSGERPEGTTLGYGLPATAGPDTAGSHPADDYYALGATLHWAATGLDPVVIDPDPAVNRERTLACLAAALPAPPAPLARPSDAAVELVAGLLGPDAEERSAAAAELRRVPAEPGARPAAPGIRPATPAPPPRTAHRPPVVTADLLDRAVRHTLDRCVRMAHDLAHNLADERPDASPGAGRPSRPRALLSRYDGAAGLGLELLQHPDRPEVRDAAAALARWTAAHPALGRLGPGLYDGRAGVDLFLAQAAHLLGTEPVGTGAAPPSVNIPDDLPADLPADQVSGAAGLGTARLLLARLARADDRPEEAERHAAVAAACARRLTDGRPTDPREAPNPGTAALVEGFAHGRAGLAHFLLALPGSGGGTAEAARRLVDGLAEDVPRLAAEARAPGATRRYGSWCRGLAGLGSVLLQAGRLYREPALLIRAAETAAAALVPAPRTGPVGQCCGLAGIGELLVDLAVATGDERHWRSAEEVAGLILARGGGPYDRPLLPGGDPSTESASWAAGTPGVLGFLRRLSRRGGPRPGTLFPA